MEIKFLVKLKRTYYDSLNNIEYRIHLWAIQNVFIRFNTQNKSNNEISPFQFCLI